MKKTSTQLNELVIHDSTVTQTDAVHIGIIHRKNKIITLKLLIQEYPSATRLIASRLIYTKPKSEPDRFIYKVYFQSDDIHNPFMDQTVLFSQVINGDD